MRLHHCGWMKRSCCTWTRTPRYLHKNALILCRCFVSHQHIKNARHLYVSQKKLIPLQWRHNERDGVPSHRRLGCLRNRLLRRRSKKTSKLRVTGLCEGNPQVADGFAHKGPVTRKMFPFDDVIMLTGLNLVDPKLKQWLTIYRPNYIVLAASCCCTCGSLPYDTFMVISASLALSAGNSLVTDEFPS